MAGKHPQNNKKVNYVFFARIFDEFMLKNIEIHQTDHFHPHDYDEYKQLDTEGVIALYEDFNDYCKENMNVSLENYYTVCNFELYVQEDFDFKTWDADAKITHVEINKKHPPAIYFSLIRRFVSKKENNIYVKKLNPLFKTRQEYNQYITLWRDEHKECYTDFTISTHFL